MLNCCKAPTVLLAMLLAACDEDGSADCERSARFPAAVDSIVAPDEPLAHDECFEFGPPSAATCPPDSTLTYEGFAKPFMETYCTSCHSSTLVGEARQGATDYHDYDSEQGILAVADHIDQTTAAGPNAVNELMPVGSGPVPSLEERKQLGEYLACALAAM